MSPLPRDRGDTGVLPPALMLIVVKKLLKCGELSFGAVRRS